MTSKATPLEPMMLGVYDGFLPLSHDALSSMTKCGGSMVLHPELQATKEGEEETTSLSEIAATVRNQVDGWTRCGACGGVMQLVLQAFAPLPISEEHNRMLYVFACNSSACASKPSDSWKGFSVQIARDDVEAAEAEDEDDDEPIPVGPTPRQFLPNPLGFPPIAVDITEEPGKEIIVPTDVERAIIRETEENEGRAAGAASEDDVRELEEGLDLKNKPIDISFDKFRRRVARCPRQVLRYQRGGQPIFMNQHKTLDLVVPACERCGGPRSMELQLMPTILYFLNSKEYVPTGKSSGDDGTDFATVTMFTCAAGCLGSKMTSSSGSDANAPPAVVAQAEFLFVEPAPTVEEESSADGRPDLRRYFGAPQQPGGDDADE